MFKAYQTFIQQAKTQLGVSHKAIRPHLSSFLGPKALRNQIRLENRLYAASHSKQVPPNQIALVHITFIYGKIESSAPKLVIRSMNMEEI